jgi:hypothetical protein
VGRLSYTVSRDGEVLAAESITDDVIKIGRNGDIRLDDSAVSRMHAVLEFGADGLTLIDLASSSGTFLNGRQVDKASVRPGDKIHLGDHVIEIGGFDVAAAGPQGSGGRGSRPRYCSIKLLDKCPHCGGGLPINGVLGAVLCNNCQEQTELGARYWERVLEHPDNDYHERQGSFSLNFETNVRWRAERPACTACGAELPVDDVAVGTVGSLTCAGCGHENTTYPVPQWLAGGLPSAVQVYCGEREGAGHEAAVQAGAGARPVVLSCPQCDGALKVTSASDRLVPCQFCQADVFLPDELWKRLHPAKTSETWYIRYEGPSQDQLERERQQAEQLRRQEREVLEHQSREVERKRLKPKHLGWTAFGGFIATVVVVVMLPMFAGDGDPLFGLAGALICPGACQGCDGPLATESWTTQTSDGSSTQYDFYCVPPGADKAAWVAVSDETVIMTMFFVALPICLVLAGLVLVISRLKQR